MGRETSATDASEYKKIVDNMNSVDCLAAVLANLISAVKSTDQSAKAATVANAITKALEEYSWTTSKLSKTFFKEKKHKI